MALAGPVTALAAPARRVVSLDFGLAETLLEIGVVPVGLPAIGDWADWVVEPRLPAGIADLGTALEVNLELLSDLAPDLIVTTPYQARLAQTFTRIAPVVTLPLYDAAGEPLRRASEAALRLAAITGDEGRGEALVARVDATFAGLRAKLAGARQTPIFFVNFLDARHVRVYGAKSLFQDVLDRLGLANAWTGPTNDWGFATVGIEALATRSDARLFYLEPAHDFARLSRGPLWRSLPFVKRAQVDRLPPILMFGALPSAERFARIVGDRLAPAGPDRG
ncbi:iron-siderophore ABC transporter substrate-binding protein [Phreatobacter stygius]|uniref:Iron-siderophore ABC transporter substrate-binding protein n=2 Tax=Phreatobacter stygius TaxID=1940610 RepID=A0A4D7BHC1_9HYPH|nr:iron-siderophore ABC transporter substrate-binding protein [Phreatobacter stygius]